MRRQRPDSDERLISINAAGDETIEKSKAMNTANPSPSTSRSGIRTLIPESVRPFASRLASLPRLQMERLVYERPDTAYRKQVAARATTPNFHELADRMVADGGVVVPRMFAGDQLAEMQEEFERLVRSNPPGHGENRNSIHVPTRRLTESAVFSRLALDAAMRNFAEYYWGKPVVLVGTGGTRIEPTETEDYGSYQWHHDGKRKQVRAIVLLTDLPDDGQRTDYVLGTHAAFRYSVSESRIEKDKAFASGKVVPFAGPAGSVAIFDTNGLHRGNRNPGPRRDTWNFAYRAPNPYITELTGFPELHPDVAATLDDTERRLVRLV